MEKLPTYSTQGENSLELSQVESSYATKLAKLLRRLTAEDIEKYQHSKLFPFAFYVDEAFLKKLDSEINERLSEVAEVETPEFQSETRFQDLSSIRFDSFEKFLDKAGDKKDPESTSLAWSKFALDASGELIAGGVQIQFITEKRLYTQDNAPGEFNTASIMMTVSGSDQNWVERTFLELVPYIDTAKLGGIFRPLWFFRNKWFTSTLAHVLSWIGFFIGINFASKVFSKKIYLSREEVLKKIISETEMTTKFDLYVTQILTPSTTPWWEPIIVIGVGAVSFSILYISGVTLLPKLTPNSNIAIGLSNRRAQRYLNTFKFIIFGILVSGILVPLVLEIIKQFL